MVLRKHDIPVQSPPAKTGIGSVKALVLALLVLTAGAVLVLGLDGEDSYAAVGDTFTVANEGVDIEYRILTEGTDTENGTVQVGIGVPGDTAVDMSVTTFKIPATVTFNEKTYDVIVIGGYAFTGCTSLTSVTIPDSVIYIESSAFYGCSSLTSVTIPDSVTTIGGGAFYNCSSLTSVTIPISVTSIEDSAFSECSSLTSIDVEEGNTMYVSENGVLFNKDKTELIAFPAGKGGSYTIPDSVITIRDDAFTGCSSLTSVTIPNSVTTIGDLAFYDVCNGNKAAPGVTVGHIFDDEYDTDCNNVCGYVREVPDAGPSKPVPEPDAGSPDGGSMMLFVGIGAAVAIIVAIGAFLFIRGRS